MAIPVVGHFDFSTLAKEKGEDTEEAVQLVDVGGGHGAVLKQILENYSELGPKRVILQDRKDMI